MNPLWLEDLERSQENHPDLRNARSVFALLRCPSSVFPLGSFRWPLRCQPLSIALPDLLAHMHQVGQGFLLHPSLPVCLSLLCHSPRYASGLFLPWQHSGWQAQGDKLFYNEVPALFICLIGDKHVSILLSSTYPTTFSGQALPQETRAP